MMPIAAIAGRKTIVESKYSGLMVYSSELFLWFFGSLILPATGPASDSKKS